MTRCLSLAVLLLSMACAAPLSARVTSAPSPHERVETSYEEDASGRPMRVRFPRHDRLYLQGGLPVHSAAAGPAPWGIYRLGWKFELHADFPDEEIWWRMRHEAFRLEHRAPTTRPTTWNLRASLISGDYLRHDTSSFVLVPGEVDIRLPAPFDIAVQYRVATLDMHLGAEAEPWLDFEVFDFAVLMDLIRDPSFRHRLAVGPGASYVLRDVGDVRVSELSPLAGARVLYGWESADGLFALRFDAGAGYVASLLHGVAPRWSPRLEARARLEWTPLAVNDNPVSLPVELQMERAGDTELDWTITLGLRFSVPTG